MTRDDEETSALTGLPLWCTRGHQPIPMAYYPAGWEGNEHVRLECDACGYHADYTPDGELIEESDT